MYNIAILGASGYTGAELIRLIAGHSSMKIKALGGNSKAGQTMASVFPHLRHLDLPALRGPKTADARLCRAGGSGGGAVVGQVG